MAPRRGPGAAALALLAAALAVLLPRAAVGQGLLYPERLAAGELAMAELFQSFEEALSFAPSEVGGRRRPTKRGTRGGANPFTAADKLAQLQLAAYYIAGAPDAFPACRFKDGGGDTYPNATFAPRRRDCNNFVPAARDQRVCSTCVSTAVAAALQIAAASTMQEPVERWRVNAASLHYCSKALVGFRTCPIGWDIAEALGTVLDAQPTIVRPDSCLRGVPELNDAVGEVGVVSWADICGRADQAMQNCSSTNSTGHFLTCTYKPLVTFHDIQRHVRRHGAVISRITIPDDFEAQFANASGLPGEEAQPYRNGSIRPKFGHAVVIVGYNNTARTWTILNSWGDSSSSPDRKGITADGTYRITMGLLGVGDQAYGVECEPAPGPPADPHQTQPWEVAKAVEAERGADPQDLNASCYLYRFNASTDTASSLVDHFGLGMLGFVHDNAGIIPLQNITYNFSDSLSQKELQGVLNTANSSLRPTGSIRPFVQCSHYDSAGKETVLTCTTNAADCTRLGANGTESCALRYSAYDLSALANGTELRVCGISRPGKPGAFYRVARLNDAKTSQRRALREILRALGDDDVAVPEDYCRWDMSPRLTVRNCTDDGWVANITIRDPHFNNSAKSKLTTIDDALLRPLLQLKRLGHLALIWLDGPLPPQLGALQSLKNMSILYHCAWGGLPANWLDGSRSMYSLEVGRYMFLMATLAPKQFANHSCGITGTVPERWSDAASSGSLRRLILSFNLLTGELPPLTGMSTLQELALSSNQLRGTLPRSWGTDLKSIKTVYLNDNADLVGLVPREWAAMAGTLKTMWLFDTGLSGCMPLEFGTTVDEHYKEIWISTNITGFCTLSAPQRESKERAQAEAMATTFTELFSDMVGVAMVAPLGRYFANTSSWYDDMLNWAAQGNVHQPRVPSFVNGNGFVEANVTWDSAEGVAYVTKIQASSAQYDLSRLSDLVSKLPALEEMRIQGGTPANASDADRLPDDLAQRAGQRLKVLEITLSGSVGYSLNVGRKVVGTLPAAWGNWTTLRELVLRAHGLTGTLPPSWGRMESLQRLSLSGNSLSGPLPPEWNGMRSLAPGQGPPNAEVTLDLSFNQGLNGTLPDAWGGNGSRMPDGITLNFQSTGLRGTIPPSYRRFGEMNLGKTNITGCVPSGINATGLTLEPCSSSKRS